MTLVSRVFSPWFWLLPYVGAGLLLGMSVVVPLGWLLAIFGLAYYLKTLTTAPSYHVALYGSWVAWSIKIAIALLWFFNTYPLDWLGLPPGMVQYLLIALYWLPAAVTLGLGGVFFAFVYRTYVVSRPVWLRVSGGALLFVVAESVGAFVFAVYTLGPGSTLLPDFSFGFVGYALAHHGVLVAGAAVGGVYALSAIVYVLAFGVWGLWSQRRWWFLTLIGALALVTSVLSVLPASTTGTTSRVVTMRMDWPKSSPATIGVAAAEKREQITTALTAAARLDPTHVILPEDARLTEGGDASSTLAALTQLFPRTVIIDSARVDGTAYGTVLRAYIYDTGAGTITTFDKQYLVPQGEYVPYVYQNLIALMPLSPATKQTINGTSYRPGLKSSSVEQPTALPAVLFCFESVTPQGIGRIGINPDTPFVAHIVSHAWFPQTPYLLWRQLDAMLRVQSVWSGQVIVQSANAAPAKVYYPNGDIVYPVMQPVTDGVAIGLIAL